MVHGDPRRQPVYEAVEPELEGHDHAWRKLGRDADGELIYRCDVCEAEYPPA